MGGAAEALEFEAADDARYTRIALKNLKIRPNTLVAGIIRGKKSIIPSGNDTIEIGDRIVVLTAGHRMHDLSDIIG